MAAVIAHNVESQIRTAALTRRMRPQEFFIDFDKLRSGFVTESQFFRILWENMGVKLSENEMESLLAKYDLKQDGRMNYRRFCDIINRPFNPDAMGEPARQTVEAKEFLGTTRSLRPLNPELDHTANNLLQRLQRYYKYRGVNLKAACEDFDRHNIGVIKQTQFVRSFPHPPEVTDDDVNLLLEKYCDPDRPGLINYLNLQHDLQAIGEQADLGDMTSGMGSHTAFVTAPPRIDDPVHAIIDRMRIAVFKYGIRTIEFFKDYDKLRSGIITEHQFASAMSAALGKEAQLSRGDIQKLVEFYRNDELRVHYKELCDMLENAFNIPDLEKKPTQRVYRPPVGALGRNLPGLPQAEEARVQELLQLISKQVTKRRLMMYTYFKDYDRGTGYSRVVTPLQFGRILHFLSLDVATDDLKLLTDKFADPTSGDVNYPAFVQCVDKEFVNYTQDLEDNSDRASRRGPPSPVPVDFRTVNFGELMARIRHHALTNRQRIGDYFQDFDPLKSGLITKNRFRRGLSTQGLSALGKHNLNEAEFEAICHHYSDADNPEHIKWNLFVSDVDSVFTENHLEADPTYRVLQQELFVVPTPGTVDWDASDEKARDDVSKIMHRLRKRAEHRRVLITPTFQDFDKHKNGHVTASQFRQCMTLLELPMVEEEMLALEAKYCNDVGFNYSAFLAELEPTQPTKAMYKQRMADIRETNMPKPHPVVRTNLEKILLKIKTMVFKNRVRVLEWMRDYDKLKSGKITKINFRRSMDLCKFELTEPEFDILEDHYQQPGFPDNINYLQFSDDIEAIFTTKHLEKAPLLNIEQFKPQVEWEQNKLSAELECVMNSTMETIAKKVKETRMQLYPLFEDYDKVHNGTLSRSQFRRVLVELELASLVPTEQQWVSIWQKFNANIGGKDDVNYNAFCEKIYELGHFEWRKP